MPSPGNPIAQAIDDCRGCRVLVQQDDMWSALSRIEGSPEVAIAEILPDNGDVVVLVEHQRERGRDESSKLASSDPNWRRLNHVIGAYRACGWRLCEARVSLRWIAQLRAERSVSG